jgi:hypothetical protein
MFSVLKGWGMCMVASAVITGCTGCCLSFAGALGRSNLSGWLKRDFA